MSTNEIIALFGAIFGAIAGGLGVALKWSVNRIVRSNDKGTDALVDIAASNAVLVVKIDEMRDEMREVNAYVRKHATIPPPNKRAETLGRGGRTATPGRGVKVRGSTNPEGDD
jgi:hypothetical protein